MKRVLTISFLLLATASFAAAQAYSPTTDILGAHNNYGRGCVGCHAVHGGPAANGQTVASGGAPSGVNDVALWGENVSALQGQSLTFGDNGNTSTTVLPTLNSGTADVGGILLCLSCHDGNLAKGNMMKGTTVESVTINGAAVNPPTFLGKDGAGAYQNQHPVGLNVTVQCNSATYSYGWDCTIGADGSIQIPAGSNFATFQKNYGWFVRTSANSSNLPAVLCTTCHNQHVMNVVRVKAPNMTNSGGAGYYQTMFFLRGPYNPNNPTGNSTTQFCRQCHGGEANEMYNASSVVTTI